MNGTEYAPSRIIVVSSGAGQSGLPKVAPYAASKHALHGFFGSLRLELIEKELPITITLCVLGNIDTPKSRKETAGDLQYAPLASASETAYSIIRAGAVGIRKAYIPLSQGLVSHRCIDRDRYMKVQRKMGREAQLVRSLRTHQRTLTHVHSLTQHIAHCGATSEPCGDTIRPRPNVLDDCGLKKLSCKSKRVGTTRCFFTSFSVWGLGKGEKEIMTKKVKPLKK